LSNKRIRRPPRPDVKDDGGGTLLAALNNQLGRLPGELQEP
jgi:hypothetical protein